MRCTCLLLTQADNFHDPLPEKRGLAAEGFAAAAFGTKSEEFGVTGKTPKGRDE